MDFLTRILDFFKSLFSKKKPAHIEVKKPKVKKPRTVKPVSEKPIIPVKKEKTLFDYKKSDSVGPKQMLILKDPDKISKEIDGKRFYFDRDGLTIFENWWETDDELEIFVDRNCYLMSKNKNGYIQGFHRFLKNKEVEELAQELDCNINDIHVHHKNEDPSDNREKNLEVLHRDEHAKRHGFNTWKEFQRYRNS